MAKQVDSVYGTALYEAAKEQGKLQDILTEARNILPLLKENPEYIQLLAHPNIEKEEKIRMVQQTFEDKADNMMTGLLVTAVSKGHGGKLTAILENFVKLAMEDLKIGIAYVTSAVELRSQQKDAVQKKLIETTGYREMEMHYDVDADLIGGMIIKIGDRIVDSSVRTQLDLMRKSLL